MGSWRNHKSDEEQNRDILPELSNLICCSAMAQGVSPFVIKSTLRADYRFAWTGLEAGKTIFGGSSRVTDAWTDSV